jgi:ribosome-associated translation inhibitor RaiA
MLIEIRSQGCDLGALLQRHVERRLRSALSAGGVRKVTVHVEDINGPRGGADLRSTVTLELEPRGSVRGEAIADDVIVAVGRATAKARQSLRRQSRRRRRERTRDGHAGATPSMGLEVST